MSTGQYIGVIAIAVAVVGVGFTAAQFFREPQRVIIQQITNPQDEATVLKTEKAKADAARMKAERDSAKEEAARLKKEQTGEEAALEEAKDWASRGLALWDESTSNHNRQATESIYSIPIDVFLPVPTRGHMVQGIGKFNAQGSRHRSRLARERQKTTGCCPKVSSQSTKYTVSRYRSSMA